jgi:hypothetical protein
VAYEVAVVEVAEPTAAGGVKTLRATVWSSDVTASVRSPCGGSTEAPAGDAVPCDTQLLDSNLCLPLFVVDSPPPPN